MNAKFDRFVSGRDKRPVAGGAFRIELGKMPGSDELSVIALLIDNHKTNVDSVHMIFNREHALRVIAKIQEAADRVFPKVYACADRGRDVRCSFPGPRMTHKCAHARGAKIPDAICLCGCHATET